MRNLVVTDLGADRAYSEVLAIQEKLHAQRVADKIPDTLLLLEHRPVYTLGRSATASHILYSAERLRAAGIERVETSRGGDVTYHGPGQLVGYPIIHLGMVGLRVLEYINALEEILIQTVATYGVTATRDSRNRGVWIGNNKLAALGIRVSHQVTMHGFALNVAPHLSDYQGILACGLSNAGVTSLACHLPQAPALSDVKNRVVDVFCAQLEYRTTNADHSL